MGIKDSVKNILRKIFPAYHVSLRLEEQFYRMEYQMKLMDKRQEMMFWWLIWDGHEMLKETQKRFYYNLPVAEGSIRSLQLELLGLLQKFDEICKKNEIIYWLDAGNLLGAIRHKGFVPWDDDLDVCISRKNFLRLCKIIENQDEVEIRYQYDNKNIYCYAKLFYKKENLPLFIDFDIYDEVLCRDWQDVEKRWKERSRLKAECAVKLRKYFRNYNNAILTNVKDISFLRNTFSEYAEKLGDNNGNYMMVSIEFPDDLCNGVRCYPKEWFFPASFMEFEGQRFPVPHETEKYLTMLYGDIYNLPSDAGYQRHIQLEELQKLLRNNI